MRSLARSGGNFTGISTFGTELDSKRLEMLMEAVPDERRIAILADPKVTQPAELQALQNGARARGVELVIFTAGEPEQIAPAMDKAKASGAGALNVLSAPLFSFNRRIVIEGAATLRLLSRDLMNGWRNGGRGWADRIRPASYTDLSAGGAYACQGPPRRQAGRPPGRATY